mgnify:FL=1
MIVTAEAKLADIKTKITEANALLSNSVDELTKDNKTTLRNLTQEIQTLVNEAHRSLNDAIKLLKDTVKIKRDADKANTETTQ